MAQPDDTTAPARAASENWGTKLGVILAVAGSAVGLGNFLRFPGTAAQYGGGIFLIPYFVSLLIVGIPLCWAEWTMGRYGGSTGFNSAPGIFRALWPNRLSKYFGVLALVIPVVIYMYYVYIEVWCLTYAIDYARGHMSNIVKDASPGGDVEIYKQNFVALAGMEKNSWPESRIVWLVVLTFAANFFFIYRGVTKGIEVFCKFALPLLAMLALVVLARVLTLGTPDPSMPDRNTLNALGFMWNPRPVQGSETVLGSLLNAEIWLAAAGQIFFSLSVGFGIILNYSSYVRRDDDIALSGLTASGANEFCEVILGGLITIPLAFLFLNQAELQGNLGTFSLGFMALPSVFHRMPLGDFFGAAWFFMLFLAAITSSLSMLQPAIAFFEEGFGLGRRVSVTILGFIVTVGALIVIHFSENLVALDTMDFWVGSFLIFVLAMTQSIIFGWIFGIERGKRELQRGAEIPIPRLFWLMIKYVSPVFLLAIFIGFCFQKVPGYWNQIMDPENPSAPIVRGVLLFILGLFLFFGLLVHLAGKRWDALDARGKANP